MPRTRPERLLALLAPLVAGCVLVDRPMLALRSVAGGIHNQCQVSAIRPFFLPDGRLGAAANGALWIEREPGGELVPLSDVWSEIDDPDASPDGRSLVFVSGREQVTAGGGHNDHVFQLYSLELASGAWRRLSSSERAETLPRFTASGEGIVFVRRAEYEGWSLGDPWGPGSIFAAAADGSGERRLTEGLFHPFAGLELVAGDTRLVFGATPPGAAAPNVYALDFPAGGEPRVLLAGAYLPVSIPGSDELLVASVHADGHGLARVDLEGRILAEYPQRWNELLGLAVSPDGRRIVLSDHEPEAGRSGEHRLWALDADALARGDAPELVETLPYRVEKRFKPLDVVKPFSWWFRRDASPGSR